MVNQFWRRGKKAALKPICPYGKSKIQSLIREGVWRENLHFVTDPSGDRIYNLDLVADWMANMNDPVAHIRACELYLASLPSNQAKNKTPKSQSGKAA
ncbi:hypothetical protein [Altericista sp. CCNU0014]|uniref:hypothetical protein n=1 Tax=Altericista sp. CCNU0014 TaxID=3082949 RepID=UPI00384F3FFE